MEALGEKAFASTQENANSGTGNTNPRKTYMRYPAIKRLFKPSLG